MSACIIATLSVGDQLIYEDGSGWSALDSNGNLKTSGSGGGGAVSSVTNSDGTITISPTTGNVVASLPNVNSNVGSFTNANVTVNAKGLITAASNGSGSGAPTGTLFNLQQGQLTTTFTTSATSFTAITGLTVSITPTSSSSTVLVRAVVQWGAPASTLVYFRLMRDSTAIGVGTSVGSRTPVGAAGVTSDVSTITTIVLEWLDSPATTSATTYSVQGYSNGGGGLSVNASYIDSNNAAYMRSASTITACEVYS